MSSPKWKKVDSSDSFLSHFELIENYTLIYGRTYTAHMGYDYSETNRQILNLKKAIDRPPKELKYKELAVNKFVDELGEFLQSVIKADRSYWVVPVPPSKTSSHPEYDDRVHRVAKKVAERITQISYRPIVETSVDREAKHMGSTQRDPDEIYSTLSSDADYARDFGENIKIIVLDDVLTSGASFEAMRRLLEENLSHPQIVGIFWANPEYNYLDLLDEIEPE